LNADSLGSSAIATDPVKVSVLTDMSGPYAGITAANVEAAKMAIEDFSRKLLGQDILFVYRDTPTLDEKYSFLLKSIVLGTQKNICNRIRNLYSNPQRN
jgi:hypothetical protein